MTSRDMQCIISVAKHKSISKAAKEVCVTQQTLSNIVKGVETEIGTRIFSRLASGIELTDIGAQILPVIIALCSSYERHIKIISDIVTSDRECLSISFEHKFLSALIPEDLLANFNIIKIKKNIANTMEKCIDDVGSGKCSMGVCHKRDRFDGLRYVPIINETASVLMCKDHYLASKKELVLSDLKGVPLVELISKGTPKEILIGSFLKEGFYPTFIPNVSDIDSLDIPFRNIRSGAGVAIGARFYIPEGYHNDDIICIPLKNETISMAVGFLTRPVVSADVSSFIKAVTDYHSTAVFSYN
jgi:DNA-binding transcriptional LysR family regulator